MAGELVLTWGWDRARGFRRHLHVLVELGAECRELVPGAVPLRFGAAEGLCQGRELLARLAQLSDDGGQDRIPPGVQNGPGRLARRGGQRGCPGLPRLPSWSRCLSAIARVDRPCL